MITVLQQLQLEEEDTNPGSGGIAEMYKRVTLFLH